MGQKQIVTRTQIAKMAGTDVTHFLNQRARFVAKSLGDQAGLQNVGVHLINLPVGAVASAFHRHLCTDECIYILEGSGVARIGPDLCQNEAGDFIGYPAGGEAHDIRNTGSTHMICLVVGQRLEFDIIDYPDKTNGYIAMLVSRRILWILPLLDTRGCLIITVNDFSMMGY